VLLSISIMWIICLVLTLTDTFEPGNLARTDVRLNVLTDAPWFRIPYPFQFGWPTFTVSACLGMLAGVLACTVESLSYYPTVAKMCGELSCAGFSGNITDMKAFRCCGSTSSRDQPRSAHRRSRMYFSWNLGEEMAN
jgi:hypothetical protein